LLIDSSVKKQDYGFSFLYLYDRVRSTKDEVTAAFEKLVVGGSAVEPLAPVFWSPLYGFVIDRLGVHWLIMAQHP